MLLDSPEDAPTAVGGAPESDISMVTSIAAATVLKSIGMSAINLGAQTPVEAIVHAAEDHHARLVWVSMTHLSDGAAGSRFLRELADAILPYGAAIIVGGRMVDQMNLTVPPSVHIGRSMTELAAFARGVMAERSASDAD